MSIIRTYHNKCNPYVQLNKSSLWDSNLSLEAAGLWARLISRPDNWTIHVDELRHSCKIGRNKAYDLLTELIKNGYAYRYRERNTNGSLGNSVYLIFEEKYTPKQILQLIHPEENELSDDFKPIPENREMVHNDCELEYDIDLSQNTPPHNEYEPNPQNRDVALYNSKEQIAASKEEAAAASASPVQEEDKESIKKHKQLIHLMDQIQKLNMPFEKKQINKLIGNYNFDIVQNSLIEYYQQFIEGKRKKPDNPIGMLTKMIKDQIEE